MGRAAKLQSLFETAMTDFTEQLQLKDMGKINSDFAKGILDEMNDKNSSLGIDTMNSFVHNYHFSPKADSLRTGWDNMERFLTILWQNMPSKQ